ncbi:putative sodium-coupled neutral amino acid transporter 10 [Uranotaenia lowii]|uniref:putative sodium-coupled neutral amino acid transporter 10 n=1 Tax=Uranotaenia lowii TaxID=190385 RepID=UPI0024793944|nr:putative sodium-coupled neutral amino acid transporter 10 [Uranotaenia lowii]XP_055614432.1 putative sodium-coupled neutral amino acid transporter 10 [Uranotaenia lowii]
MERNSAQTVTLINSIIGVGILSMPFCFQQCGIILSLVLLFLSAYITKLVCSYMIKSAIISRRKNFEQIAFYAFGPCGKLLVELCVVGYLLGTCVAYFVVVGDLGPQITAKVLSLNESSTLRLWVMIVVTIVCIVPLGLLRNVDSLSSVCTASLGFYLCLVLKIIVDSREQISRDGWFDQLNLWRVDGILQCLPIFSMALSCQMQLYEIYATMPTTSLDKMSRVIQQSTNMVTCIYALFGFFGYVSFNEHRLSGNILVNFAPSFVSDIIKIGFVLSVAFSFPLVIFPCRVSLYSLLYKRTDTHFYIPESKFRPLTVAIVAAALLLGVLIPSVEVVIGFVGSTIGVAICIIIPAACYMNICKTNMTEKQLAQVMIVFGFLIMILGTYANLDAVDRAPEKKYESLLNERNVLLPELPSVVKEALKKQINEESEKFDTPVKVEEKPLLTEKIQPKIEEPVTVKEPAKIEKEKVEKKEPPPPNPLDVKQETVPKEEIINRDAILKEDKEIAVEEKEKIQKEISELQSAKKELEAQVEDIKEQLVRKNEETQQLVLKKFDEIAEKIVQKASKEKEPAVPGTDAPVQPVEPQKPKLNESMLKTMENDPKQDPIVQLLTNQGKLNAKAAELKDNTSLPKLDQPKAAADSEAPLEVQLFGQNETEKKAEVETKPPQENKSDDEDGKPLPPLPVEQKKESSHEQEPPKKEIKAQEQQSNAKEEPPGKDTNKKQDNDDDTGAKRDLLSLRNKRNAAPSGVGPSVDELNCVKKTDEEGTKRESTFRQQQHELILDDLIGGEKLTGVLKNDLLIEDGKLFKK